MRLTQHILFVLASITVLGGCALQKEHIDFSEPLVLNNQSMVVFFRQDGSLDCAASVWVDDKIVGTLLPNRYAQSFICPGKRSVRIEAHYKGKYSVTSKKITAKKGEIVYLNISDASTPCDITVRQFDPENALRILKNIESRSHIINRHTSCTGKYIELDADTLFIFGKSSLTPAGKNMLNDLAKNMNENVTVKKLRIEGYTDRLGSSSVNDRISLSRAKSVAAYLKSQNVTVPIRTIGMGERYPISKGCVGEKNTPELLKCLAVDRRVKIEIIGLSN